VAGVVAPPPLSATTAGPWVSKMQMPRSRLWSEVLFVYLLVGGIMVFFLFVFATAAPVLAEVPRGGKPAVQPSRQPYRSRRVSDGTGRCRPPHR